MKRPKDQKAIKDWDGKNEAAQLSAWANQLEGLWWNATPEVRARFVDGRPLRDMSDSARLEIAAYLRRLASNPHALQVMLDTMAPGRRGRKRNLKTWQAALEFDLRRREDKFDLISAAVAKPWGISRATLTKAWSEHAKRTPTSQRLGGWRYWAHFELKRFRDSHRSMKPRERRAAFIRYLHSSN